LTLAATLVVTAVVASFDAVLLPAPSSILWVIIGALGGASSTFPAEQPSEFVQ
jgi:hypothetical protein